MPQKETRPYGINPISSPLETYLHRENSGFHPEAYYMAEGVHSFPKPKATLLPDYNGDPDRLLRVELESRAAESEETLIHSEHPYRDLDLSAAEANLRKRFNLKDSTLSSIEFFENSDQVLIILPRMLSRVLVMGPAFPQNFKYASWAGRQYTPLTPPLTESQSEDLEFAMGVRRGGSTILLERPNVAGSFADIKELEAFAKFCTDRRIRLVVDEATGDFMSDEQSALNLVEEYGIIVVRSTTKGTGIRGAWVTMHPDLMKVFESVHEPAKLDSDMPTLLQAVTDQDIIGGYLSEVRQANANVKRELDKAFREAGLEVVETDYATPTGLVGLKRSQELGGGETNFAPNLRAMGIVAIDGKFYAPSYPEIIKGQPVIDNGWVRYTTPDIPLDEIPELAERIKRAEWRARHAGFVGREPITEEELAEAEEVDADSSQWARFSPPPKSNY